MAGVLIVAKRKKREISGKQIIGKTSELRANKPQPAAKKAPSATAAKKAPAAKPTMRLGYLVHDVSRMRKTLFDQAVKQLGITRAQWWALSNLSRNKSEGMSQSDLARFLDVGKPAVSGLIDRLTEGGIVERRSHSEDRRIHRIYITDLGYNLIQQMAPIAADLNAALLQGISAKDLKNAEDVLIKMKQNLRLLLGFEASSTSPGSDAKSER